MVTSGSQGLPVVLSSYQWLSIVLNGYLWQPVVLNGEIYDATNHISTKTLGPEVQKTLYTKGAVPSV